MRVPHETVLVVDDDPGVRRFVSEVLSKEGYAVLEAQSGEEALRAFLEYPGTIHFVITDVFMPRMTGPEWVRQLDARRPEVKVLFISAMPEPMALSQPIPDRRAFLKKPFGSGTLVRTVRRMLDGS